MASVVIQESFNDGTDSRVKTETITSGQLIIVEESIPNSSTDLEIAFAFVKAKLKAIRIFASGTMVLETNSGSAADESFSLTSSNWFTWRSTDPLIANPFANDVASVFATNSSGAAVTLYIIAVVDPT